MKHARTKLPASGVVFISLLFFSVCSTQTANANSILAVSERQLFLAPDESSDVIAVLKPGEALSLVADILAGEGIRWYLIRVKTGALGWMKPKNTAESKESKSSSNHCPLDPFIYRPKPQET
jgi:hypothetical protein